ncbi:hypothetical protein Pelo_18523 [Pelomyxa schiedti]|nr:hypothetical protein Pelo_18523 [Pelomyxa schiedti]
MLCKALKRGDLCTASWLEDTFHIMSHINSDSERLCSTLSLLCSYSQNENGIKWFLHHSALNLIPEPVIVKGIKQTKSLKTAIVLLESFHINALKYEWKLKWLTSMLHSAVSMGINAVKNLVSLMGKDLFTKEVVVSVLTGLQDKFGYVEFSKEMIREFDLGSSQVKESSNFLLFNVLAYGNNSTADWIVRSFGVTLEEFITMVSESSHFCSGARVDLGTWKVIVGHFPGLTAYHVRKHMMAMALSSPVTAQFVMDTFPSITKGEFTECAIHEVPTVSDECIDAFKTPNTLGVIFRVSSSSDDNVKRVKPTEVMPITTTWGQFINSLPRDDVAWAIINVRYVTSNGGKRMKQLWLSWIPEGFRRGSTKETVAVKFMTPMVLSSLRLTCAGHNQHGFHHHAGTAEGLNVTDIVERVSRFERDPIDQASVTAFVNGTPSFTS